MEEELDRIEKLLRANGGEIPVGILASKHGRNRDQLNALVAVFPEELEIDRRAHGGRGRPPEFLRLKSKSSKSSKPDGGGN
jgi:hypothetical protein